MFLKKLYNKYHYRLLIIGHSIRIIEMQNCVRGSALHASKIN